MLGEEDLNDGYSLAFIESLGNPLPYGDMEI